MPVFRLPENEQQGQEQEEDFPAGHECDEKTEEEQIEELKLTAVDNQSSSGMPNSNIRPESLEEPYSVAARLSSCEQPAYHISLVPTIDREELVLPVQQQQRHHCASRRPKTFVKQERVSFEDTYKEMFGSEAVNMEKIQIQESPSASKNYSINPLQFGIGESGDL